MFGHPELFGTFQDALPGLVPIMGILLGTAIYKIWGQE